MKDLGTIGLRGKCVPRESAAAPWRELKVIVRDVLVECGLEEVEAQNIMDKEWFLPNPKEDARPLANLRRTFKSLHGLGVAVAILTADFGARALSSLSSILT